MTLFLLLISSSVLIDKWLSIFLITPLLLSLICPLILTFNDFSFKQVRLFVIISHGICFVSSLFCFLLLFNSFGLELTMLYSRVFTSSLAWVTLDNPRLPPVEWSLVLDFESITMVLLITFISFLINIYALSYMRVDPNFKVFMIYFSLFTFFMLVLVTAPNLLQMFLGWEGVGLCSFLLISFWNTRLQAVKSAMKALLMNKIGDCFFLLGIGLVYFTFESLDLNIVYNTRIEFSTYQLINLFGYTFTCVDVITIFFVIAAMSKSAQLGLHTWLVAAMAGPTPVSALLHAATMVTAGIFLLIRCKTFIIISSPGVQIFIVIIGGLSCLSAGLSACFQTDLKRVIAYSTCSQLGYMVIACGLCHFGLALFHLVSHAFFKALLFLSAGAVIHALNDEQDMRRMGGLDVSMPWVFTFMLVGNLSLVGIAPLSGFYSKEPILNSIYFGSGGWFEDGQVNDSFYLYTYILGILGLFCTAIYSINTLLIFSGFTTHGYFKIKKIQDPSWAFIIPMQVLTFFSIFFGYFFFDLFFFVEYVNGWIDPLLETPTLVSKYTPYLTIIFAFFLSLSVGKLRIPNKFSAYHIFMSKTTVMIERNFFFDSLYNNFIVKPLLLYGYFIAFKSFDKGWLEFFGPIGITSVLFQLRSYLLRFNTGYIFHYTLSFSIGFTIILLLLYVNHYLNLTIISYCLPSLANYLC